MATQGSHRVRARRWSLLIALVLVVFGQLGPLGPGPRPALAAVAGWAPLPALSAARLNHSATLLPDGRVLVAGGQGADGAILASAEIYDPAANRWSAAAPMRQPRWYHSATLLPGGQVLVAGGQGAAGPLNSAELFDPLTGQWTTVAPMSTPRSAHSATLIGDGSVLVAGGIGPGSRLASAEIYSFNADSWLPAGILGTARAFHSAARLPDGRVLVAGGANDLEILASVEIFDPAIGGWGATTPMAIARDRHSATVLPDGRVLVAGGFDGLGQTASVEIYDLTAGGWAPAAPMPRPIREHSATLLPDGRLLIAGGVQVGATYPRETSIYDPAADRWAEGGAIAGVGRDRLTATLLPSGMVLLAGGGAGGSSLAAVDRFDPGGGGWQAPPDSGRARVTHTASLLPDGQVLVVGGFSGAQRNADLYDPTTGSWSAAGDLRAPRTGHTATLLPNGELLVVGSNVDAESGRAVERYSPGGRSWRRVASTLVARRQHSATLLPDGRVLVAGGGDRGSWEASAELYDPSADSWTAAAPMATARGDHTATLLPDGRVLVAGGVNTGGGVSAAELYDPISDSWSPAPPMSVGREEASATLLLDGRVLVSGGALRESAGYQASAEIYNPATGAWSPAAPMAFARWRHTTTLLPDGRVLAVGGWSGSYIAQAELYDPATNRWSAEGALATARDWHTTTLLPDGRLLVVGGYTGSVSGERELSSPELYTPGPDAQAARRPQINAISERAAAGSRLIVRGSGLQGVSEASSGSIQSSPVNGPLLRLRSLANGQTSYLRKLPDRGGDTIGRVFVVPADFPPGHALASLVVAGIASPARVVMVSVGSNRYVAPGGVDGANTCQAQSDPCATIGHALRQSRPTEAIRLAAGSYREQLQIDRSISIVGLGAGASVIDGGGAGTTLSVAPGVEVYLSELTISGGLVELPNTNAGGGIYNQGTLRLEEVQLRDNRSSGGGGGISNYGTLTLVRSELRGNSGNAGGGIFNVGQLTLLDSVVGDNQAASTGGGIANGDSGSAYISGSTIAGNRVEGPGASSGGGLTSAGDATLTLVNSTVTANRAPRGGGIHALGPIDLIHTTVTENQAEARGGGISGRSDGGAAATLRSSIVAGNSAPAAADCQGRLGSAGGNLIGSSAGCEFVAGPGDQAGGASPLDPRLGPLADNGGPTATHALLEGSPARDAVAEGCGLIDQRGLPRPQGAPCDAGAYEAAPASAATLYVSTTGDDSNDCASPASACRTVRSAVERAPAGATVVIGAGTYTGALPLSRAVSLLGAGPGRTILRHDGTPDESVIGASPGVASVIVIAGLSLRNGNATPGGGIANGDSTITVVNSEISENRGVLGGGIYNAGTLTLIQSEVSGNYDPNSQAGGIYNTGTLLLIDSQVAGNSTIGEGGGIVNVAGGTVSMLRSSLVGNSAGAGGGAINRGSFTLENSTVGRNSAQGAGQSGGGFINSGALVVRSSTIAGNRARGPGGGIATQAAGSVSLQNSILADNSGPGGPDCAGPLSSAGGNVVGDSAGCALSAGPGDQLADPRLGPLAAHGGLGLTFPLLAGSPAIDAADAAACPPTDQRGAARAGAGCDSGAFEFAGRVGFGFDPARDSWGEPNFAAPATLPLYQEIFGKVTYYDVREERLKAELTEQEVIELGFSLEAAEIEGRLPVDPGATQPDGALRVQNPIAALLYEAVFTRYYDDEVSRGIDGALKAGLCAGMSAYAAEFARAANTGAPGPRPADFGAPTVSEIDAMRADIVWELQLRQGRQLGADFLERVATVGRHTPASLQRELLDAFRAGYWADPLVIGIVQGGDCAGMEIGHALLAYDLELLPDSRARIFVYDPNYAAGDPQGAGRAIELDLRTNRWRYQLHETVTWEGERLFSVPLSIFTRPAVLPTAGQRDILMINGAKIGAWGAKIGAWGGDRGAWAETGGPGGEILRAGCYLGPDGPVFVETIGRSYRLAPLSGPRSSSAILGGARFPDTTRVPAGQPYSFYSAGGELTSLTIAGPQRVIGLLASAGAGTVDRLDVDASFTSATISTSDRSKPASIFQMFEAGGRTGVISVSNVDMAAGEALDFAVRQEGGRTIVTVVNRSDRIKYVDYGVAVVGPDAVGSIVYPDVAIPPHEQRRYVVEDLSSPGAAPVPFDTRPVGGAIEAYYALDGGAGAVIPDQSGADEPLDLRIEDPKAVRWTAEGLLFERETVALSAGPAARLTERMRAANAATVELLLRPTDMEQGGLARILTISGGLTERNLTLAQEAEGDRAGNGFVGRLRTAGDRYGRSPDLKSRRGVAGDELVHVILTYAPDGAARLYVNGQLRAQRRLPGGLSSWDPSYPLALGNEVGGGRGWLGLLRRVSIFSRAMSAAEVEVRYAAVRQPELR